MGVLVILFAGCTRSTEIEDPSFFTLRPVQRASPPPCLPPAVPQLQGGEAVRCYELGPAGVDASDVTSAEVVVNGVPPAPEVAFELSAEGAARFTALARAVGLGNRAAIVVDGVVVSAPRIQVTEFQGRGIVTGLDADGARRLSERLNRG